MNTKPLTFFVHIVLLIIGWLLTLKYYFNIGLVLNISPPYNEIIPFIPVILQSIMVLASLLWGFTSLPIWWAQRKINIGAHARSFNVGGKRFGPGFLAWASGLSDEQKKTEIIEKWRERILLVYLTVNLFFLFMILMFSFYHGKEMSIPLPAGIGAIMALVSGFGILIGNYWFSSWTEKQYNNYIENKH